MFEPESINKLVEDLRPDNVMISLASREFAGKYLRYSKLSHVTLLNELHRSSAGQTDLVEEWFQVNYSTQSIDRHKLDRWASVKSDLF